VNKRIFFIVVGLGVFFSLLACDLSVLPTLILGAKSPTAVAVVPNADIPTATLTAPSIVSAPNPTTPTPASAVPAPSTPTPPGASATAVASATPVPPSATPVPAVGAPARKIAYSVCDKLCDQPEHASVWIVNADGSAPYKAMDRGLHPSFSPDGNQFAFEDAQEGVYTANSDGGSKFKLTNDSGASVPDWNHSGNAIVYVSHQRCPVGNSATPVVQRRKIIVPGRSPNLVDCSSDIIIIAPDGNGRRVLTTGDHPTWSPDDTQIAYDKCDGGTCGIFIIPSGGGTPKIVTNDVGAVPHWSPDGKKILYQTDVDGIKQVFSVNVDGSGKKQLLANKILHVDAAWAPNGLSIYYRTPELGSWDIIVMNADGTNPRKILGNVPPVDWANERISLAK
jgi:Tol biopolymer transport system component